MADKRKTCTDHCGGCDQHFHGTSAFEAHRDEGTCVDGLHAIVRRGKRTGLPSLQVWTEDGSCDKMAGCFKDGKFVGYVSPVTIYNGAPV